MAFPLQQRLKERASMLPYTYIVCRVYVLYSMDDVGINCLQRTYIKRIPQLNHPPLSKDGLNYLT